ncbi:MAG: hypothetical protein ACRDVG_10770, partial [Jatrophihabitantaceae bacterium]
MTMTGRLRGERSTDHLDRISTAQQARHRQQHMRGQTRRTACPARAKHPDTTHRSLPSVTPRRELTRAARADQLTRAQPPIDLDRIGTYHDHGCLHQH